MVTDDIKMTPTMVSISNKRSRVMSITEKIALTIFGIISLYFSSNLMVDLVL